MSVRAIDRGTVHRICSGQVVLSLAVAVKELVENSLDAGATTIEVRLKEHGSELVEVIDNGGGVTDDNFQALALKHHTSKISDFSDLEMGVATFGFRGEALSSLCALSDLSITTCHVTAKVGTKLEYDNHGQIKSKTPCARQAGTTVSLKNLFHSLPVRRKEFIRNIKKDFVKMVQLLQGYCVVSTGVKITCHNLTKKGGKQVVLSTSGNPNLKDNITDVFGAKQFSQLVEIVPCSHDDVLAAEGESAQSIENTNLFKLSGYVSRCNHGYGRGSTDRQFFFFNNRPCDYSKLSKLVNEVYHCYNRHQYPFIVLCIATPREHVDVNVTPDKRKVMLHQEKALLLLIKVTLKKLFEPMQGVYDTSDHTPSPAHTADSAVSSAKDTPSTRGSLKRFLHGADNTASQPQSKQAKLSDYGVTRPTPDLNSSLSDRESPILSTHIFVEEMETRDPAVAMDTEYVITDSTKSPSEISTLSSGSAGINDVHETETDSLRIDTPVTVVDDLVEPISNVGSSHEDNIMINSCNVKETVGAETNAISFNLITSSGTTVPPTNIINRNSAAKSKAKTITPHNLKSPQYEPPLTQSVSFDLRAVAKRLEAAQLSRDGESVGGGRCFRAKITPSSNKDAENELRKEIRKSDFSKMKVLGQFNLGFIITRLGSDLFIVDQHATDEKYNFERLQREMVIKHQKLIRQFVYQTNFLPEL
ncbi:mismatch repair endonuclease PMS2-like isoform X2 [Halichondria panicea]|uniref:mismatch repair endonuclease PMS2-like isoform X2 n=1 Tax=Halichondria panicea TaxID=6063 RepID=UPI00312B53CD